MENTKIVIKIETEQKLTMQLSATRTASKSLEEMVFNPTFRLESFSVLFVSTVVRRPNKSCRPPSQNVLEEQEALSSFWKPAKLPTDKIKAL